MRRRVVPILPALAALAVLSGCGVSEEGPMPGLAAELDGESISLAHVDEVLQDYCDLRAAHADAPPAPRASIRGQLVLAWAEAVATARLAEEHGISLPSEDVDRSAVEEAWGGGGDLTQDNYESFEWLTWLDRQLGAPVEQLGARELLDAGQAVEPQAAHDRGIALVQEWLAEHDPDFNPVFGTLDTERGLFASEALSIPVSDEATATEGELTEADAAALPAAQRCGPEPQDDAAPPPGA